MALLDELLDECNGRYKEFADLIGKNIANKNGMKEVIQKEIWPAFKKDFKRNTTGLINKAAFKIFKASSPEEIREFLGIKSADELIKYLSNANKAKSLTSYFKSNKKYLSNEDQKTISLFLTIPNALK